MRTKDIEVDGIYAVAENYHWTPSKFDRHPPETAFRARVVATGVRRHGNQRDGVLIEWLDDTALDGKTPHPGKTIVRPIAVRESWGTYEPRYLAALDRRQEARAEAERGVEALAQRIRDLLPEDYADIDLLVPRVDRFGRARFVIGTVTYEQLAEALEAAATVALNQTRE